MYRVIKEFTDKDTRHVYKEGDNFPIRGHVSEERVNELSGDQNNLGEPLIEPYEVVIKVEGNPDKEVMNPTNTDVEPGKEDKAEEKRAEGEYPKHTGGAWYELSNGEKVQGKDEALEAEKELK